MSDELNNEEVVESNLDENEIQQRIEDGTLDFSSPSTSEADEGYDNPISQLMESATVNARDFIDNTFQGDQLSKDDIRSNQAGIRKDRLASQQSLDAALNESTNPLDVVARESIRAPLGAIEDAAHSVLLTADKTGDQIKKSINETLGRPVDPWEDPDSESYSSWFDGSKKIIGENQTPLGELARGFGEFFLLTRWTGAALGPARVGLGNTLGNTKLIRAANPMYKSNRFMRWSVDGAQKVWNIGTDGAIADFIMSSSEGKNMANMAEEHAPWLLPDLMAWLSADPGDSWYEERFKSALVGSSFNYVGHVAAGLIKSTYRSGKWLLNEKNLGRRLTQPLLDKADKLRNKWFNQELEKAVLEEQSLGDKIADIRYDSGQGINPVYSKTDYVLKHLDDDDALEYARLLDGEEPSDWLLDSMERRGKISYNDLDFLQEGDFYDTKGILNMPTPNYRELAMQDLFEAAAKIGQRKKDYWLPNENMSSVQKAETILRETDPFVNPNSSYADFEKISYGEGDFRVKASTLEDAIKERQWNFKENNSTDNVTRIINSDPYINQVAAGNKDLEEIYQEVVDEMGKIRMNMSPSDYTLDVDATMAMARPFLEPLELMMKGEPVDLVKAYKKVLLDGRNPKKGFTDTIEYKYLRRLVVDEKTGEATMKANNALTVGVAQRDANLLVLHSLGKVLQKLSKNTLHIKNGLPITRNWEMITDLMKVIFIENKKWGYHWGNQGQAAQTGVAKMLAKMMQPVKKETLAAFKKEADDVFDVLLQLKKEGKEQLVDDIITLSILTDGQVRSVAQIGEYLDKLLKGGHMENFNGELVEIPGRFRKQMMETVYQTMLGHPKTAIKANFMTNLFNVSRSLEQWIGMNLPHRKFLDAEQGKGFLKGYEGGGSAFTKQERALIGVQYSAMWRAHGEAWKMFTRNMDINLKPKLTDDNGKIIFRSPDYGSKFDMKGDDTAFRALDDIYNRHTTGARKWAHNGAKLHYDMNKLAIMRFSQSVLNSSDAFTRTIIGRQEVALEAAKGALKAGVDPEDLVKFTKAYDEKFKDIIFKKTKDDVWVVKPGTQAQRIGDEMTLMTPLEGWEANFKKGVNNPLLERFFFFLRPTFNQARAISKRLPTTVFGQQYRDIVLKGDGTRWGIAPEDIPRAVYEIEGRIALGTSALVILTGLASQGMIIGSMPKDAEDRKLWKLNKIQPNSIAIPKPWNPLKENRGDNGWIYVGVKNLDILGVMLSQIGNLFYYSDIIDETTFDETLARMSWTMAAALGDISVIESFKGVADLIEANDQGQNFEAMIAKLTRMQAPLGGQSRWLAELFNDEVKEANTFAEMLIEKDFLLKSALPNDYDWLQPQKNRPKKLEDVKPLRTGPHNPISKLLNSLLPVSIHGTEGDFIKQTLLKIRYNIGDEIRTIDGVELNSQEISDLKKVMAWDPYLIPELTKMMNSTSFKNTLATYTEQELKANDGWSLADQEFTQLLRPIFTRARQRAKDALANPELFPEYNNGKPEALSTRLYARQLQKKISKQDSTEGANKIIEKVNELKEKGLY